MKNVPIKAILHAFVVKKANIYAFQYTECATGKQICGICSTLECIQSAIYFLNNKSWENPGIYYYSSSMSIKEWENISFSFDYTTLNTCKSEEIADFIKRNL